MSKLIAKSINRDYPNESGAELFKVVSEADNLEAFIEFFEGNTDVKIKFENIFGYKSLDESDLFDWWNFITLKDGWLFEVEAGGWKEFEATRSDFMSAAHEKLKEFLIISNNMCLSVLCYEYPSISKDT